MEFLGLTGVQAAITITLIGIAGVNVIGWLKSGEPVNPRKVATSVAIGMVPTLFLVASQIDALGEVALTEMQQLIFTVGLLGEVLGIDFLAKSGFAAAVKSKKSSA